jgi:peptide/nickel transport system permease protein
LKYQIKVIHWIFALWLLTAVFKIELIVDYLSLLIDYMDLFLSDSTAAISVTSFSLIDVFSSALLFIIIIPLVAVFQKKYTLLKQRLNFSFAILTVLCFVFLFAPIISNENSEFSKNLSVTKLLSPFSTVKKLELKKDSYQKISKIENFRIKMDEVIKPSFNNAIIFADSVKISEAVKYFQKNEMKEIESYLLRSEDEKPLVEEKFFLLGTDEFGRDLFSRLLYGTRISLTVGLGAVVISFIIGIILGFIAGYRGGLLDVLLNRFTETFLAFPVIYLVVLILALFGSSIFSVVIVLGISGWMSLFKIVKSEVLTIKQKDFFSTAELIGLTRSRLLLKEILPVIMVPVIVNLVFLFSNVVLAEAALSYLGLGTGNAYPSWGSMISSGQEYITKAWWLIAFPGLGLIFTLYSINSSARKLVKVFNPMLEK